MAANQADVQSPIQSGVLTVCAEWSQHDDTEHDAQDSTSHIVIKDGQARIEGKEHLKAEMVARMYVDGDASIEDVMAHYGLTAAEVHAALAYYYDNRAELDAAAARVLAEIHEHAMTLDKFKAKLASRRP